MFDIKFPEKLLVIFVKNLKHSAISAGRIAPTFKKPPTASTPWIVKYIACSTGNGFANPK